ncbi:MAG: hypothetical protein U0M12_00115 [Acutalibacteraceae bacterium]|nr:hypothetical protein [Acutalibacteraceae bacterium]
MRKYIKQLLALSLAVIAVISFTGCGTRTATIPEENKVKVSEMAEDATGVEAICKTLKEKEYVSDDCIKTNAELIGAKSGYRFDGVSVNGSKFSLEIYEYADTESDTANKIISSVKENNSFNLFGKTVSYSYMSDNGKYLLIYPDSKSVSDKADDNENVKRKNEVMEIINSAE